MLNGDDAYTLVHHKRKFIGKINRRVLKSLSLYFAINKEFTQRFMKSIGKKVPVFESFQGVDHSVFSSVSENKTLLEWRKRLGIGKEEFVLLSVGFLLKRKGYHRIFEELSRLNFPFRYVVVGESSANTYHSAEKEELFEMDELIKQGKSLLGDRLQFAGTTNHVEKYYAIANIFLHGSYKEGTPNVLLEAMCMALPVVVKKLDGLSGGLVRDGINAFEFEEFDELAPILIHLHDHADLRKEIGKNASRQILENYTFEKVATELLKRLNA